MKNFNNDGFRFIDGGCYDKNCEKENKSHIISFTFKNKINDEKYEYWQLCVNFNHDNMSNECDDIVSKMKLLGWDEKCSLNVHFEKKLFDDKPVKEGELNALKNSSIVFCEKFLTKDMVSSLYSDNIYSLSLYRIFVESFSNLNKLLKSYNQ